MRVRSRDGFTLVELLVVIAIIGILVALLLPAVQAAREAARSAHCKNNLKQLGAGCLLHESRHGWFPTGGWGPGWTGEPQMGFGKDQPGGWHYNVLPFIEQEGLYQLGADSLQDPLLAKDERKQRAQTPVKYFNCPTRRDATLYPYRFRPLPNPSPLHPIGVAPDNAYANIDPPSQVARSDYAACSGSRGWPTPANGCLYQNNGYGSKVERFPAGKPISLAGGSRRIGGNNAATEPEWEALHGTSNDANGVIFRRSQCSLASVIDGESFTYLLGERAIRIEYYSNGSADFDSLGWDTGYDDDVNRWTYVVGDTSTAPMSRSGPEMDARAEVAYNHVNWRMSFGSAHPAGFHMAFCDGSVRKLHYVIDLQTHRRLGNRKDGEAIDVVLIK